MLCRMAAIAVGVWITTTKDDGTGGWDEDGRRDGSVVVSTSVDRGAIGGGGHDDVASSAWVVALGEHDGNPYLKCSSIVML